MAYLCFDLGTTRLKVGLVDTAGRIIGRREARLGEYVDGTQRWQSADEWWRMASALGRELAPSGPVDAISVSGRGGAAVFLDAHGEVLLHPWGDSRHAEELARLRAWRRSSAHLSNYAAALIAKILWARTHRPEIFRRVARVLYAKDLLLFRLAGRSVTDPSSGPDALSWPQDALRTFDVPARLLPEVELPWTIAGPLTHAAAAELGIPAATPVVVGAHDGICANLGCGAAGTGCWALTLGTHAVVRCVTASAIPGARRFYGLPPDRHVIGGNAYFAGRAADWFLDVLFGRGDRDRAAHFAALEEEATAVPVGSRGVAFEPFLGGQVAPEWRPDARAGFSGLTLDHRRGDLYRAVLEGGAFALRAIVRQLAQWCGDPPMLRLTGGGANSELWTRILADVLRVPLEFTGEGAECVGAALLAAVALGRFPDCDAATAAMVRVERRFEPRRDNAHAYEALGHRLRPWA